MSALFLSFHIWLSASFLLPCMLILRWGGLKWSGLSWLTRSMKGWLILWSISGLVVVFALGLLAWVINIAWVTYIDGVGVDGLATLVWPTRALLRGLHTESSLGSILLGISLGAIGNVATYCGLAALSWWLFQRISKQLETRSKPFALERYGVSLLFSICLFGVVNDLHFLRPVTCFDCFFPYGLPFTFFREGGFAGGAGFVWSGVFANFFVMLIFGVVLGWVWKRYSERHCNLGNTTI